ncbi:hypothetical protein [Microbulbifer sp. JTAC008]|uniref:hypothetical protein n=1 Tax=unclassified Microbulbifer TaxID=2619833 RepID=UPI0040396CD9
MRLIPLLILFLAQTAFSASWKSEFFEISLPSNYHIEETGSSIDFAAFVPNKKTGHPYEMIVIHMASTDNLEAVIQESNEILSEYGESLGEAKCDNKCTLLVAEAARESGESRLNYYHNVFHINNKVYVITYFTNKPLSQGRSFIQKIIRQVSASSI